MRYKLNLYLFVISFVIFEFATYASNDMIMPGMLIVVKEFGASISNVAFSLSIFLFGNSMLQLFLGPLAERFGKRKIIIFGNLLFLIYTVFIAFTNSIDMFMLGRLLQGSSIAFIAMGYALIHENFDDKSAVKIIAIMANITIFAPIIGPFLGGIIIHYFSWRYVFIFSMIIGVISLIGLLKFTPKNLKPLKKLSIKEIILQYYQILILPKFAIGAFAMGLLVMPCMFWIGISPTLIMHSLKLSMNYYMLYQAIALSGFLLSTIANQILVGRVAMLSLVKIGVYISIVGFALMGIFDANINIIVFGLCLSCMGLGLQLGTMARIVGKLEVSTQSMLFSLLTFIQIIIMGISLEIGNIIMEKFEYSLFSFVILCLLFGVVALVLVSKFIALNKGRNWQ